MIGLVLDALRRRLVVVTVRGWSMSPTLSDGDRVLIRRVRPAAVRRGQVVVLQHPDDAGGGYRDTHPPTWMIKRCAANQGDPVPPECAERCPTADGRVPRGVLAVLSDNRTHPNDSRKYGLLPHDRVLGVVVRRA